MDRDMLMRYYLGLGVGHTHQSGGGHELGAARNSDEQDREEEIEEEEGPPSLGNGMSADRDSNHDGSEAVDLTEEEEEEEDDSAEEDDYSDDAEVIAMDEMYWTETEF